MVDSDIQARMSRLLRPQEIYIKIKSILSKIEVWCSPLEKNKHPIKYMKNNRKKEGHKSNLSSNMKVL